MVTSMFFYFITTGMIFQFSGAVGDIYFSWKHHAEFWRWQLETPRIEFIESCHQHNRDNSLFRLPRDFLLSRCVCYTHRSSEHRQTQVGRTDFDRCSQSGLVFWCTCCLHASSLNRSLLTEESTSWIESQTADSPSPHPSEMQGDGVL